MSTDDRLALALAKAVESYKVSKARNRHTREGTLKRMNLTKLYPGYYRKLKNGNHEFIGKTADDHIEEFLVSEGYERGSSLWYQLAEVVMEMADLG
ncbi:MAG TPA: hypothetical protein DIT46_02760 [Gemmatimonadetes bacterium]|nr:hypothetical protein [Gemmatimonadota bacterium]|tara:strand:+ start:3454 stop:3741 length:288 start_codon:yes stop_codon:yes gene_type:complete